MNFNKIEIIGIWENDNIEYQFSSNHDLVITWKKINRKAYGTYCISEDKISFNYNDDKEKWTGRILELTIENLVIEDTYTNILEFGKIDTFKKSPAKVAQTSTDTRSIKHKNAISIIIESVFKLLSGIMYFGEKMNPKYKFIYYSFLLLIFSSIKPQLDLVLRYEDIFEYGFYDIDNNGADYYRYITFMRLSSFVFVIAILQFFYQEIIDAKEQQKQ